MLEVGLDVPLERVDLEAIEVANQVFGRAHPGAEIRTDGDNAVELQPRQPLHDQAQAAVGQFEHLVNVSRGANPMKIVLRRLFDRRVLLGEHTDELAAGNRLFNQANGALAGHCQRQERIWKQHGVAERKNRQLVWNRNRVVPGRIADVKTFVFSGHILSYLSIATGPTAVQAACLRAYAPCLADCLPVTTLLASSL